MSQDVSIPIDPRKALPFPETAQFFASAIVSCTININILLHIC